MNMVALAESLFFREGRAGNIKENALFLSPKKPEHEEQSFKP